jgi:hypothetical protein
VLRQVVVVFDGLQGRGFTVEPQVVDRDGIREESLYSLVVSISHRGLADKVVEEGAKERQ